jgi:hypothetical protein
VHSYVGINGGEDIVEEDDGAARIYRPGKSDAGFLPATQIYAAFADFSGVAGGKDLKKMGSKIRFPRLKKASSGAN